MTSNTANSAASSRFSQDSLASGSSKHPNPTVLVIRDKAILTEDEPSTEVYAMDKSITDVARKGTSLHFHSATQAEGSKQPLFYLVHPLNADHRQDVPDYYITAAAPNMIGNICLENAKGALGTTEFKALLSPDKSALDNDLFDDKSTQQLLFTSRSSWTRSRIKWKDATGREIAYEEKDGKAEGARLIVTASMSTELRDALAATWALRLWYDAAESKEVRRDKLERMTPASAAYSNTKCCKRTGAMGALAGASI